jgi:hypothetical protein
MSLPIAFLRVRTSLGPARVHREVHPFRHLPE